MIHLNEQHSQILSKITCFALLFAMLLTLCVGCGATAGSETDETSDTASDTETAAPEETEVKKSRILFIGNSYTYYNDLPIKLFWAGAKSAGLKIVVDSVTKGSYTLEKFASPTDEMGKVLIQTVKDKHYDCVIYQEQSTRPISNKDKFFAGLRSLEFQLKDQKDRTVLYATWGRKYGANGLSSREMGESLAEAYEEGAELIGADVANVGLAFADCVDKYPEIELYDADTSHPSLAGSYLAALILLKEVFDLDPEKVDIDVKIDEETIAALKEIAAQY